MDLIYAKIDMNQTPGIVVNTQVINSGDHLDPAFTWVDITDVDPQPGIGWTYNGSTFSQPTV